MVRFEHLRHRPGSGGGPAAAMTAVGPPRWMVEVPGPARLPAALASWLRETGSLTRRLQAVCGSAFALELHDQVWTRPFSAERSLLGLAAGEAAFVRQVHLCAGRTRLVYARTVMPRQTLGGNRGRYARLGDRPLGEVLFSTPGVERGLLEFARLTPGHGLHKAAAAGDLLSGPLWARRSLFRVEGYPLLIHEVFLPGVEALAAGAPIR